MPNLQQALPTLMEKFWDILKKSIGGFLGITGFLLSLILVPIYLFFLLNEKPRIEQHWKEYLPLRASPLQRRSRGSLVRNQQLRHRLFSGTTTGMSGRWHTHRDSADAIWSQFCAGDWRACCRADNDPLYRHHHLLGASRSDCRVPMGRLGAPDLCNGNFHRYTKSGRHILRPTNRWELRWVASDDRDRIDLCLGFDHWRGNRSPSCRSAYSHRKGVAGAVCLEPAFEEKDRGLGEVNSCS